MTAGQGPCKANLAFRLVFAIEPLVGAVIESEQSRRALGTDCPVALGGLAPSWAIWECVRVLSVITTRGGGIGRAGTLRTLVCPVAPS